MAMKLLLATLLLHLIVCQSDARTVKERQKTPVDGECPEGSMLCQGPEEGDPEMCFPEAKGCPDAAPEERQEPPVDGECPEGFMLCQGPQQGDPEMCIPEAKGCPDAAPEER